jgi:hypothetical protein
MNAKQASWKKWHDKKLVENPNHFRDYIRNYRKKNSKRINELFTKWSQEHPGYVNSHRCITAKKYPEMGRAVAKRLYNVKLKPNCEVCGVGGKLEGHHPDYDKPLEVMTLCKSCHEELHVRINRNKEPLKEGKIE